MSRIGNKPITLPEGVTYSVADGAVNVKGPKGELSQDIDPDFKFEEEEGTLLLKGLPSRKGIKHYMVSTGH